MDSLGDGPEGAMGFDMPMMMNQQHQQQPQFYPPPAAYPQDASPVLGGPILNDDAAMGTGEEHSDAKRRRIARVR